MERSSMGGVVWRGVLAASCALAAACGPASGGRDGFEMRGRVLISDQVHGGGTPGFFWLPPLVPETEYGAFAAGLSPVVRVERQPLGSEAPIATFEASASASGEVVRSDGASQYQVEWHTGRYPLEIGATYRIRVLLDDVELGFVDAQVVATGEGRRDVSREAFFPLVAGRTLPIKFRIDEAAARCGQECVGRCGVQASGCRCAEGCPEGQSCDAGACVEELGCPTAEELPIAAVGVDYVLDGTAFWAGAATSWSWSVTGGVCDALLLAQAGAPSFTLSGADTSQLTFRPTLPGDYAVSLAIQGTNDVVRECEFPVRVRAPGLRVALCWETMGQTDLDLHVHRSGTTTPWFTTTTTGQEVNPDDCYYRNCRCVGGEAPANWGYAASPVEACAYGEDAACWATLGTCRNPRLDFDNIRTPGVPEIVAVDAPANGETFRVMTHYYGGAVVTHPVVSVYCGMAGEVATLGASPTVQGFTAGGMFGMGPMWRAADVTALVDGSGATTGCTVAPLHPPGESVGYWVTDDDRSY